MSGFKDKVQVFSLGLMLGLLIGGGFFILKLDHYFSELSQKDATEKEISEEMPVEPEPGKQSQKKLKNTKTTNVSGEQQTDTLSEETPSANAALLLFTPDSLRADSSMGADNIVVKKDELLSARNLEMLSLGSATSKKDSVLSQLSGIRDDGPKTFYTVEFWQSPINYKGYKMSKNKILLYGMGDSEGIRLFKLDDVIYLKHPSAIYRLDHSSDFRQLERVSDEGVLARLK